MNQRVALDTQQHCESRTDSLRAHRGFHRRPVGGAQRAHIRRDSCTKHASARNADRCIYICPSADAIQRDRQRSTYVHDLGEP